MKKLFVILLLFMQYTTIDAQYNLVVLDFNTITLIDTLTKESYGYVEHDTELQFNHITNTIIIKNHFTNGIITFYIKYISILEDTALYFCNDSEGSFAKVLVGFGKVTLLSKAIPYTLIYSNE